jgi:type I restriction-modification system DNA methylase subunit
MAAQAQEQLAQYFTPRAVAAFAFDALASLGMQGAPRRVVDPACGEGVFLRLARERFPAAELWGCDLDGALAEGWRAAGLVEPAAHLLVQDGLDDAPGAGLRPGRFDLVVGNPPYGFGVPRPAGRERIEERFLRRFVELARPGGWVALVVPEGILANARSQALRDEVRRRAALRAVVALPEATFARSGTRARTALVLARKGREERDGKVAFIEPHGERPVGRKSLERYLGDALHALRQEASLPPPLQGRKEPRSEANE